MQQTTIEATPTDQPKLVEASAVVNLLHRTCLLYSSLSNLTSTKLLLSSRDPTKTTSTKQQARKPLLFGEAKDDKPATTTETCTMKDANTTQEFESKESRPIL
ncbi:Uncharacterized protein Rs2_06452 [Raphanus sativus]|nr:Uncharacterized protein Rs2_06452 [Raphanus sativus]